LVQLPTSFTFSARRVKRSVKRKIKEWLNYMRHLQANYPYLFSLALRTNPLDPSATPEIK
jgi:hypothetical protein